MPEIPVGQWLTLTELSDRSGRKIDAVRAWGQRRRRERRHTWRKNNAGEWTVEATPEVMAELALDSASSEEPDASGVPDTLPEMHQEFARLHQALAEARLGQTEVSELRAALTRAEDRADRAAAKLDEVQQLAELLRSRVEEARHYAVHAEAQRDTAQAVAAAEIAAKTALVDELRAMLAETRRPWWWRWMGGK